MCTTELWAIAITAASTGASVGIAADAASSQNEAAEAAARSQNEAAALQAKQLQEKSQVEKQQIERRADQVRGRLRVAAGEAGVGIGGSFAALTRQADFDEAQNLNILQSNLASNLALVQTGRDAKLAQLQGQIQNPLLAAFAGGVQGLSTGLNIVGGGLNIAQGLRDLDVDKPPLPKPIPAGAGEPLTKANK